MSVKEIREKTYNEMTSILEKTGRCIVIRPTGFGKTGLLTRLIRDKRYPRMLYIYPAEVVRNAVYRFYFGENIPEDAEIPGVDFMTNAKLSRATESELNTIGNTYDILILDECHKMGGEKISANLDDLLERFPHLHLLGATATPERTDAVDIIGRYFGTNQVFNYNLHDAFQDGIIRKPYYIYCNWARPKDNIDLITSQWKKELDTIAECKDKLTLAEDLKRKTFEIADKYNVESMIRKYCNEYADTDYMKFIVFFSGFNALHQRENEVKEWFGKAFPDHSINTLEITSETPETSANVNKLKDLSERSKGIDLIFSVDMLNLGYHINSLTGIVMYRTTSSSTIYVQELGRTLSAGNDKPALVFDIVDNLHNHAIYDVLGHESIYTKNARERMEYLEKKCREWDDFVKRRKVEITTENINKAEGKLSRAKAHLEAIKETASEEAVRRAEEAVKAAAEEVEMLREKMEHADKEARIFFGGRSFKSSEFSKHDTSELNSLKRRFSVPSKIQTEGIQKEDLIVVDTEAEYKEMIRKLVAEPIAFRANRAWQNYLENGGKYRDENGVPFTRKEQFLKLVPPENLPLAPFCKIKRVTIDDVMTYVLGFPLEKA